MKKEYSEHELFDKFKKFIDIQDSEESDHFTKAEAHKIVSELYHKDGTRMYMGEKYCIEDIEMYMSKYSTIMPHDIDKWDMYVAVNAQYHDYCKIFKTWFGDSVDSYIVESAICFWFKDDDYTEGNKVFDYFEEMLHA